MIRVFLFVESETSACIGIVIIDRYALMLCRGILMRPVFLLCLMSAIAVHAPVAAANSINGALKEEFCQQGHILKPFTQRWDADFHHVETVVKILAETTGRHFIG